MGLLNSLFGKTKEEHKKEAKNIPWIPLVSLEQLEKIRKESNTKLQLIFKHSTSCGISSMVLNSFIRDYDYTKDELDVYYLDLHAHREVSNETGYSFQVVHQSPQLLLIKNGGVVAHSSHGAISASSIKEYV